MSVFSISSEVLVFIRLNCCDSVCVVFVLFCGLVVYCVRWVCVYVFVIRWLFSVWVLVIVI